MAMIIMKGKKRLADLQAIDPLDERGPVGGAAKLAVGDGFQPHRFLQRDDFVDRLILDPGERLLADFARMKFLESVVDGPGAATGCRHDRRGTAALIVRPFESSLVLSSVVVLKPLTGSF